MPSLPIVILSILVLLLSGTAAVLAVRLRAAKGSAAASPPAPERRVSPLEARRERAATLCTDLRRTLTHIHTAIPSAVPGLAVETIRLLCADGLKDRTAVMANTFRSGFSDRLAPAMDRRDLERLDGCLARLSAILEEVRGVDEALTPLFKTWSLQSEISLDPYARRLSHAAEQLDELHGAAQSLLHTAAGRPEAGEHSVQERIRRLRAEAENPPVRDALEELETLAQRHFDGLDRQTKARLTSYYLPTLEYILEELGRAERTGEDAGTQAELSCRVIRVLSQVVAAGGRMQQVLSRRQLEAEVAALERLAALRGDAADGAYKFPEAPENQ